MMRQTYATSVILGVFLAILGAITLVLPAFGATVGVILFSWKSIEYLVRLFARKAGISIALLLLTIVCPLLAPLIAFVQLALLVSRLQYMWRNLIPLSVGLCLYVWLFALAAAAGQASLADVAIMAVLSGCVFSALLMFLERRGHDLKTVTNVMVAAPTICLCFFLDIVLGGDDGADCDWDIAEARDHR